MNLSFERLVLCLIFAIPGITLVLVSVFSLLSEKSYNARCLKTTAVIADYRFSRNSTKLKPLVTFTHNGKERKEFAKASENRPEELPIGSTVGISFTPGKIFFEVRIDDERLPPYSIKKACFIMLAVGILLLIIAGCCVILG